MHSLTLVACLGLALAPLAQAQFSPPPFLLGGEYQLDSDVDGGGSFSRAVARARVSVPLFLGEDTIVGLGTSYQFESYQFDNLAPAPWDDIHRFRIGLVAKQELANGWSWLALPFVSSDAESGAEQSESFLFGGLGAAWYRISLSLIHI